jgi:hypothetical protein
MHHVVKLVMQFDIYIQKKMRYWDPYDFTELLKQLLFWQPSDVLI